MPVAPPPPPSPDLIDALFPLQRSDPAKGVFELGLVLGGTVAAGAYTAGALDCLLEILEGWQDSNPPHQTQIPFVAGASGGSICAGLLALLSRKRVPHITASSADLISSDAPTGNPLWDVWVNGLDGMQFLSTSDIGSDDLASLLNPSCIDQMAKQLARFAQTAGNDTRPYFPAPFRMAVTLTNLRGIPYVLDVPHYQGWGGAVYTAHHDYARFAIPNGALAEPPLPHGAQPSPAAARGGKRPDEFWVDPAALSLGSDYVDYQTLINYAIGSAAFPAGLVARQLTRPAIHYMYRPYVRPKPGGAVVELPPPDWQTLLADGPDYSFTTVDGGTFDNDPVQLVHQALAGMVGENLRDPATARRALFMIDPLAAKPRHLDNPSTALFPALGALVKSLIDGSRYLTADMALMADKQIYSRFQLVPTRDDLGKVGEEALATDFLEAFGGFFCRDFRVHDFILGRINMRNYLRSTLILRGDNSLFDAWGAQDRVRWAVDATGNRMEVSAGTRTQDYFLPVIPDTSYAGVGPLGVFPDARTLPWPWKKLDPQSLQQPISDRVDAILTKLRKQELPGLGGWLLGGLLEPSLADEITKEIIKAIQDGLAAQGLWPQSG